jgi:hypothetical protein
MWVVIKRVKQICTAVRAHILQGLLVTVYPLKDKDRLSTLSVRNVHGRWVYLDC